jgi:hypothetical protein
MTTSARGASLDTARNRRWRHRRRERTVQSQKSRRLGQARRHLATTACRARRRSRLVAGGLDQVARPYVAIHDPARLLREDRLAPSPVLGRQRPQVAAAPELLVELAYREPGQDPRLAGEDGLPAAPLPTCVVGGPDAHAACRAGEPAARTARARRSAPDGSATWPVRWRRPRPHIDGSGRRCDASMRRAPRVQNVGAPAFLYLR